MSQDVGVRVPPPAPGRLAAGAVPADRPVAVPTCSAATRERRRPGGDHRLLKSDDDDAGDRDHAAPGLKREFQGRAARRRNSRRASTAELSGMKDKVQHQGLPPRQGAGGPPRSASTAARSWPRSCRTPSTRPTARSSRTTACGSRWSRRSISPSDQAEVERRIEAKGDLAFKVALEMMPKFETGTFDDIELERQVAAGRPTRRSTRPSSAWPTRTAPSRRRRARTPTAADRRQA